MRVNGWTICGALGLVTVLASGAFAQQSVATPLLNKDLPDLAGKEVMMTTVVYPPGVASAPHRHDAHTFVYVLEGTVVMQVAGGPAQTLGPGQTFYENPTDVHATSRNASDSAPAKILVFMIKDKGKPTSRPAN
jgi:quercetin dioxygenase-like cupin family protein